MRCDGLCSYPLPSVTTPENEERRAKGDAGLRRLPLSIRFQVANLGRRCSRSKLGDSRAGGSYTRTFLTILPARRQPVHTLTRLAVPLTNARTRWMFGFQRRFVRTWEWLTLMPNDGFLPQTSHTLAMTHTSELAGLKTRGSFRFP